MFQIILSAEEPKKTEEDGEKEKEETPDEEEEDKEEMDDDDTEADKPEEKEVRILVMEMFTLFSNRVESQLTSAPTGSSWEANFSTSSAQHNASHLWKWLKWS